MRFVPVLATRLLLDILIPSTIPIAVVTDRTLSDVEERLLGQVSRAEVVRRWQEVSVSLFRMLRESSTDELEVILMEGESLRPVSGEDFDFEGNNEE